MDDEEAQSIWDEYYDRVKRRRLAQADGLWAVMRSAGINDGTIIAIDFEIFCTEKSGANQTATQLSENYDTKVVRDEKNNVWLVQGTTRPSGVNLDEGQHLAWVEFMCDVAAQYSCVLSSWELETFAPEGTFASRTIEIDLP